MSRNSVILPRTTSETSTDAAKEKLTRRRRSLQSIYGTPSHKQPASVLLAIVETGLASFDAFLGFSRSRRPSLGLCSAFYPQAVTEGKFANTRTVCPCLGNIYIYMTMISEIQVDATWSSACNIQLVNAFRRKGFWVAAAFKLHFYLQQTNSNS